MGYGPAIRENLMEIVTEQQQTAHNFWLEACSDDKADRIETLPFPQWYTHYCRENGLFNDC